MAVPLGLFKFEVADNIQIARRPDGLRNISRAFSATKPGRPNGLPIPAYATDNGERADCEYSRFANNRFATNLEIVSSIYLTDCRPLQL